MILIRVIIQTISILVASYFLKADSCNSHFTYNDTDFGIIYVCNKCLNGTSGK